MRTHYGLTIVNYDKLSRRTSKIAEQIARTDWDCIVLDEMHKIARPTSNRTKFIVGSGKSQGLASKAKYRYGLTGTPLNQSRYQDLWAYMRFLYDDDYMTYADFKKRYLKMRNYPPGTYNYIVTGYTKHVDELKATMAQHAQYLKSAECQDLPEIMQMRLSLSLGRRVVTRAWVGKAPRASMKKHSRAI